MIKTYTLWIILVLGCWSCTTDTDLMPDNSDPNPTQPDIIEIDSTIETATDKYLTLDSDYIFDQDKLPVFQLNIPAESLEYLDSDPAAEEYVEGTLIFEGDTLSPVGVRYKGSIGAYVNCLSGNDLFNPNGFKTCTKLSMKIKINWNGRTDKFYGLKKLQFHSMNLDVSQMRDRLGYWLFREMNAPAPRCVHARLFINGQYSGLYALVEQIDGRFTRYNWDDGKGNLYKEVWPLNSDGQVFGIQKYLDALRTNEDDNPSVDIMRNFGLALANSTDQDIQEVIETTLDVDEILSYSVVDRTIRHDDGPFHWYCNGSSCSPHNYYWYEEPGNEQLHLIAWDLDNAFENITDGNPVTEIADGWGEISNNCRPFTNGLLGGIFGIRQKSAACDILIGGLATYEEEYETLRQKFLAGSFSQNAVDAQLEKWTEQIRMATRDADELHNDAINLNEWEAAIQKLRSQIQIARTM